jgi:hypothetical protein
MLAFLHGLDNTLKANLNESNLPVKFIHPTGQQYVEKTR